MTNPNPNQTTTPNVVIPFSKAPESPAVPSLGINPNAYTPTGVVALGARTVAVPSAFNLDLLRDACTNLNLVANTSHSTGISPVLKEFVKESGLVYTVTREIYDDGDLNGHKNGNAIDIVNTDIEMDALTQLLRKVPDLFSIVIYANDEYTDEALYIYDGVIVDSTTFPDATPGQVHIASSLPRFAAGMLINSVREALGGEDWTVPQFTNRDVYVLPQTQGDGTHAIVGVNFW